MPSHRALHTAGTKLLLNKLPPCWSRKWQPTPVLLPGKLRGQRSLAGSSPQGHRESDTTECLSIAHTSSPPSASQSGCVFRPDVHPDSGGRTPPASSPTDALTFSSLSSFPPEPPTSQLFPAFPCLPKPYPTVLNTLSSYPGLKRSCQSPHSHSMSPSLQSLSSKFMERGSYFYQQFLYS